MVELSRSIGLRIRLIYYPPYHSKYNPIERCWAALEQYWNGALLDSVEMGQSNELEGQEVDYSPSQASLREGNQSFAGSTQGMSRILEAISRITQMRHHYSSNLSWGFISALSSRRSNLVQ